MEHEIEQEENWQIVHINYIGDLVLRKYDNVNHGWRVRFYCRTEVSHFLPDSKRTWSLE